MAMGVTNKKTAFQLDGKQVILLVTDAAGNTSAFAANRDSVIRLHGDTNSPAGPDCLYVGATGTSAVIAL